MIPFFQLKLPDAVSIAVERTLREGYIGPGKAEACFADGLKKKLKCYGVVLTTSGTVALQIAARTIGIKKGMTVGVPCYGTPQVANAFTDLGCKIYPLNIDQSGCIYYQDLIKVIADKKIDALCYVDFSGRVPALLKEINQLCRTENILLIEDACCAFGNKLEDGSLTEAGMTGDIGALSFSPQKLITTGQGGAIICKTYKQYTKAYQLTHNGIHPDSLVKLQDWTGSNLRMTDIQAIMGSVLLNYFDTLYALRSSQIKRFIRNGVNLLRCSDSGNILHNIIFVDHAINFSNTLRKYDIDARINYSMIHRKPFYHFIHNKNLHLSGGEFMENHAVYLPFGSGLKDDQIDYISEIIEKEIKGHEIAA